MTTFPTDNFNDTLPGAPVGRQNVKWQADPAANSPRNISSHFPPTGGRNAQTGTSYTIAATDRGQLVTLNNVGAVAVSLPNANTLASDFLCFIVNLGAGTATLTPTTSTIDGLTSLALAQYQGIVLFGDGANYVTDRGVSSSSAGGGLNGVNSQTANYTTVSGDNGKLISFNSGSAVTLTLPAAPPSATWAVLVENVGAGILTVSRNGLNIDGAATNLTVYQNQGVIIFTDGTNYFTSRGACSPQPYDVVFSLGGKPPANTTYPLLTFSRAVTFPGNFAGAVGSVGANPTATASYTILKNGVSVGTISISTGGVFTFTSTGGTAVSFAIGDRLTISTPTAQDATLSDVAVTLAGTR